MSDFINNFWSVYVAASPGGHPGLPAAAVVTARKKVVSDGDNTTGHVWDEDLRELNNPMPRWWMGCS
jgi:cytochrome c oxidase cbb3-type subunit 3